MLSLVNVPTVAFDLVRHPNGAAAVEVLIKALLAGPAELTAIEHQVSAGEPFDRQQVATWRSQARSALDGAVSAPVTAALADLSAELPAPPNAATLQALATASICRGSDLSALLTDDILAWTTAQEAEGQVRLWPGAVDAFVDALGATLAAPALPARAVEHLSAPVIRVGPAPVPGDLGPHRDRVDATLQLAATLPAERIAELATSHGALGGWPLAMHGACWAVYLSGRLRPAAVAQLLLVRAVTGRADRAEVASSGAFTALSGVVHAEIVADLLDDVSRARLLAPLTSLAR